MQRICRKKIFYEKPGDRGSLSAGTDMIWNEDMMKKRKMIALDIDGTLTNAKKEITPATLKKLIEIQELGHIVVIASGRPVCGIRSIAELLRLDEFGGYVLAFNGAKVINYKTGEVVYQALLENKIGKELYDYACRMDAGLVTYENDTAITGTRTDAYMEMEARLNYMELRYLENFKDYLTFPLNKCLMTAEDEKAARIEQELKRRYQNQANVFRSEPFFVEIMPKDVDKAASLGKLLEILGMDVEDLIACGDGYNDLTMIRFAGVGVAMANAQQIVKEAADYVTLSNEEDGLVPVIDRFILGNRPV